MELKSSLTLVRPKLATRNKADARKKSQHIVPTNSRRATLAEL
jgi:hypothetical protein